MNVEYNYFFQTSQWVDAQDLFGISPSPFNERSKKTSTYKLQMGLTAGSAITQPTCAPRPRTPRTPPHLMSSPKTPHRTSTTTSIPSSWVRMSPLPVSSARLARRTPRALSVAATSHTQACLGHSITLIASFTLPCSPIMLILSEVPDIGHEKPCNVYKIYCHNRSNILNRMRL